MNITSITTRLLASALVAWGAAAFATQVPAAAQVPSPDSFLGFKVGEDRKLADWEQVLGYFQRVLRTA
jgi:hypothetical protein